jgi:hypothetical protein
LLVREVVSLRPPELVNLIVGQLDLLDNELAAGAIVAITWSDVRVRRLPLLSR